MASINKVRFYDICEGSRLMNVDYEEIEESFVFPSEGESIFIKEGSFCKMYKVKNILNDYEDGTLIYYLGR